MVMAFKYLLTMVNVLKKANVPPSVLLTQRIRVAPALLAGAPKNQNIS